MESANKILTEIQRNMNAVEEFQIEQMVRLIEGTSKIFIDGSGRSGLMIKAFANRLLHLGYDVHVIGEITTPHTISDGILILNSASGSTERLLLNAKKAKVNRMKLILITGNKSSRLGEIADVQVVIPSPSKDSQDLDNNLQPMGSLYEQSSLILFDSIILKLMEKSHQSATMMKSRHADLE